MVLTGLRSRRPRPALRHGSLAGRLFLFFLLVAATLAVTAAPAQALEEPAAEAPAAGEVTLPLKDYLALVDGAERADAARQAAARQEPAVAQVVAQHAVIQVVRAGHPGAGGAPGDAVTAVPPPALEAHLALQLEVLVQGRPKAPVALPMAGVALAVEVLPAGSRASAAGAGPDGPGLYLVAPEAGRYTVRARSGERLEDSSGVSRVVLPRIVAPVAAMDLELPADLAWECAGAVVIDDRVEGSRRLLRLSAARGAEPVLVLRQGVAGDQAAELLVEDVTATFLQLRPEGLRRHDVVLYEVARGALADLVVEIPPGLEVERAATDEGAAIPILEGNRLIIHRQHRLRGSGYLVLSSRPAAAAGPLPLAPVQPALPPRARYLAVSAAVPGAFTPLPAPSWARVDLADLPPALGGALAALDVTAAWRLASGAAEQGVAVEIVTAPQAAALETVVQRRLTTTLLTVDGTLLHRDTFEIAQAGAVLSLDLPAGATLWSAAIDGAPVRPLLRDGRLDVPLGAGAKVVEVVEVLERAIARGRSRLDFDLAQVHAPVIEHRWRLLLPESARYRFAGGSLQPVPASATANTAVRWLDAASPRDAWAVLQGTPGVLTDRINVGGNEGKQGSVYVGPGAGAAISGRVVDSQGNALPGVTVSVAPQDGPRLTQVTGAQGEFALRGMKAGTYTLMAELQGFSSVEVRPFQLDAGSDRRLEVTLDSRVEDVITVTSESPMLDERRLSTGATISLGETANVPASRAPKQASPIAAAGAAPGVLNELRQGLVGGVRPLPITLPAGGKLLVLAGVLPPQRVTLEMEVKADRR